MLRSISSLRMASKRCMASAANPASATASSTAPIDPAAFMKQGSVEKVLAAASTAAATALKTTTIPIDSTAAAMLKTTKRARQSKTKFTPVAEPPEAAKFGTYPWRVAASLIVQRSPVVAKPLEQVEVDWVEMKARRFADQEKKPTFIKQQAIDEIAKKASKVIPLMQSHEEIDQLPVPLLTKDDAAKNVKSVHRKLWSTLYLIVKKPREQHAWQFPQGGLADKETLRDAAEREFEEECGKEVDFYTICNHPCAVYQYKLDEAEQKKHNKYGTRVFYIPALYLGGDVKVDGKEVVDYAWVTIDEMKDYFSPELYAKAQEFLGD